MTATAWHFILETPMGPLGALVDPHGRLMRLSFLQRRSLTLEAWDGQRPHAAFRFLQRQLDAYFQGTCRTFNIPLSPLGSPFQKRVWDAVQEVPYGCTATLEELARRIGPPCSPASLLPILAEAPLAILIPIHRILDASLEALLPEAIVDHHRTLMSLEMGHPLQRILAEA